MRFSSTWIIPAIFFESDAQLENILDKEYKLKCHGVHTYEHLRPLIVAAQTTMDEKVINALNLYLDRIAATTTATGGAIGDEWIGNGVPIPTIPDMNSARSTNSSTVIRCCCKRRRGSCG